MHPLDGLIKRLYANRVPESRGHPARPVACSRRMIAAGGNRGKNEDRCPHRDQDQGVPRGHRACRSQDAHQSWSHRLRSRGRRTRQRHRRRRIRRCRGDHAARCGGRLRGLRHDHEGQGTYARRVCAPAGRSGALHLSAPRSGSRIDQSHARTQDRRHSLRDHPTRRRFAAAAHPHERGGRTAVGAGRRPLPGDGPGWSRPAAGRRARGTSRQGGHPWWRRGGSERR